MVLPFYIIFTKNKHFVYESFFKIFVNIETKFKVPHRILGCGIYFENFRINIIHLLNI